MISDFFELIGVQPNHTHSFHSDSLDDRSPSGGRAVAGTDPSPRKSRVFTRMGLCRPIRFLATLRARGPYPLLAISGEQGSAKTVLSKMLKALIDPSAAPVRALPREERELMIAANNGYLLAFDNLCGLPAWLSDGMGRSERGFSRCGSSIPKATRSIAWPPSPTETWPPRHCAKHSPAAQHRACFQQAHPHVCDADGSTQTLPDRRGAEGHGAARANVMLATCTGLAIWAASIRKIGKTTLKLWMRPCTRVITVVARENIE